MATILYFSYGSNMSTPRLIDRVPSASFVSVAVLSGHLLKFHKKSISGSAKCDIAATHNPGDEVYGVVFELEAVEKPDLDKKEALGQGYEEKTVMVMSECGEVFEAVTYYATNIDASLRPFDWYKEHVIRGAHEHSLPLEYINEIELVESDPDPENYEMEMGIYR